MNDVYTIINQSNHTTEGSVIEFQCLHTSYRTHDALNTTTSVTQAECLNNGQWSPHPSNVCRTYDQETAGMGNGYPSSKAPCYVSLLVLTNQYYSVTVIVLSLGISFPSVCLIFIVGTTVGIVSAIYVTRNRKRGI